MRIQQGGLRCQDGCGAGTFVTPGRAGAGRRSPLANSPGIDQEVRWRVDGPAAVRHSPAIDQASPWRVGAPSNLHRATRTLVSECRSTGGLLGGRRCAWVRPATTLATLAESLTNHPIAGWQVDGRTAVRHSPAIDDTSPRRIGAPSSRRPATRTLVNEWRAVGGLQAGRHRAWIRRAMRSAAPVESFTNDPIAEWVDRGRSIGSRCPTVMVRRSSCVSAGRRCSCGIIGPGRRSGHAGRTSIGSLDGGSMPLRHNSGPEVAWGATPRRPWGGCTLRAPKARHRRRVAARGCPRDRCDPDPCPR